MIQIRSLHYPQSHHIEIAFGVHFILEKMWRPPPGDL